jgi:hypothetical protein
MDTHAAYDTRGIRLLAHPPQSPIPSLQAAQRNSATAATAPSSSSSSTSSGSASASAASASAGGSNIGWASDLAGASTKNVSAQEVKRRLRTLGEPITLFGESDHDRLERLKVVEVRAHERAQGSMGRNAEFQSIEAEVEAELKKALLEGKPRLLSTSLPLPPLSIALAKPLFICYLSRYSFLHPLPSTPRHARARRS